MISQLPTVKFKKLCGRIVFYIILPLLILHCDWEIFIKDPQEHYKHRDNDFSHNMDRTIGEIPIIMGLPIESVCQELRQNWRWHLDKSAPDKYMKYRR